MLRHRRFLLTMHRLALMGALLVAVAPVVSRWMQWYDATPPGYLTALCTSQGMKLVDLGRLMPGGGMASPPGHATALDQGDGTPMPAGHDGVACDYCLLAARLMPLVLALLVLPQLQAAVRGSGWILALPRVQATWPAHAARGPPHFSVA